MSPRPSVRSTSGRRGLLWAALALLLFLLVADLASGDASLLRAAFRALDPAPSRGQQLFDRVTAPMSR